MEDFWDDLTLGMHKDSSLDEHLGSESTSVSLRSLTDASRAANALPLPVAPGTRVYFANNLGAVLAYPSPPEGGSQGTVVVVKSASGNITAMDGLVFVKWDTGEFLPIHSEHLRLAKGIPAKDFVRRVASFGDLSDFMKAGTKDELVHKATKDLWALRKEGGEYVIERLFDDKGSPLKV